MRLHNNKGVYSPKPFNKSDKGTQQLLWLATIAVATIVVGCILCCTFNEKEEKVLDVTTVSAIRTEADAIEYLKANSNYSDETLKELEFNAYWPQEYFEICLKDNTISYWKGNRLVAKVEYANHWNFHLGKIKENRKNNNNIKGFKDSSARVDFASFPGNLDNLAELVEARYREEIDKAFKEERIDDDVKRLSLLYNALAGHPESYVLLGRKDERSNWKYYQTTDFPKHMMPEEKEIAQLVSKYAQATDSTTKASPLGESFKEIVKTISVKAISLDSRGERIWYGDKCAKTGINDIGKLKAPYDYPTLSDISACGWIVPYGAVELHKAKDYYRKRRFIDKSTYNWLKDLKWNAPKPIEKSSTNRPLLYYIGCILSVTGLLSVIIAIAGFAIMSSKKKITSKYIDQENCCKDSSYHTENARPCTGISKDEERHKDLEKQIWNLKKEIARLKAQNMLKERDGVLEKSEATVIEKFKKNKEYKLMKANATNWEKFSSCTTEEKVIEILDITHDLTPSFPKLNTLYNVYSTVKTSGKNEKEQIAAILEALDKQNGKPTGLQEIYNALLESAQYGTDVHDQYEICKALAQIYGGRKEYNLIASQGHDLSIWERIAVMLWATECTNELLKVFGKKHFTASVLATAAEIHKEDIMQVFATRIFRKHVNDSSTPAGALAALRKNMMDEKLAEMQSKYNVSMFETQAYRDFAASLDSIHDRLKAGNAKR